MLLELFNLKKYFPVTRRGPQADPWVRAVDNVGFAVEAGENLGIVGESGSGKTTLGRLILKLMDADAGKIVLEGKDITRLKGREFLPWRRKVQMVFQDPYSSLDPRMTVQQILMEPVTSDPARPRGPVTANFEQALKNVGLPAAALRRHPHEFSGGERQRIALARTLLVNPSLLVLDEAVSSLDVLVQRQILDLLNNLQKQFPVTYIFISHNLRVVRQVCRRIAVMYAGKIVEIGPAEEITNNPLHPYTQELLAAAIDYKAGPADRTYMFDKNSRLIDRGNNHFVIN